MHRILLVVTAMFLMPGVASACSCVLGMPPVVDVQGVGTPILPRVPKPPAPPAEPGGTYVPGQAISIPADWRGVFATAKVVDIRPLARSGMKQVVVQVTEGLVNAETGRTITFYTAADDGACGYRFLQWRDYVIESYYFDSKDPWYAAVPRGSQVVTLCARTRELNTPEGNESLAGIREAISKMPR